MTEADTQALDESEDEVVVQAQARIGRMLKDKWTLDAIVGVGGMAAVYAATHRNGKRVAVKMLHAVYSADKGVRQRFLREGYVANKVGHRGAVSVDDDDVDEEGSAFLVMELLEGEPLDVRMERKGNRLPLEDVLTITDQVLDVLDAAHHAGIVHRDLKPENIFLTKEGVAKVLDFGIARLRETSERANATQAGSLMGTPAFMAPEQARGRWSEVDGRTDLWAIGATMFTALTGHNVHEGETINEVLAMAITQPARSVARVMPTLPPSVVHVVDRALAYDPKDRWPDAQQMRAAVRAAHAEIAGSEPESHPEWSLPGVQLETLAIDGADPSLVMGAQRAQSATGQGVSNTLVDSEGISRGKPKKRAGVLAGIGVAVAAAAGLAGWALTPADEVETGSPVLAAEAPQTPPVEPAEQKTAAPKNETEPAGPKAEPVTTDEDLEFELVEAPAEPEIRPARKPAALTPRPRVQRPTPKPAAAAPAPAPAKAPTDPFATRY